MASPQPTPTPAPAPAPTPSPPAQPAAPTDPVSLTIRAQVEYYFSPLNLSKDTFLRNHLRNSNRNACPIAVIAQFPKIAGFTTDVAFIAASLKGSNVVSVSADGAWLTPLQVRSGSLGGRRGAGCEQRRK